MIRRITSIIGQSNSIKKMKGGSVHTKARCPEYPRKAGLKRFPVPDEKVSWDIPFPEYNPVAFTTDTVLGGPYYADPDIWFVKIPISIKSLPY